MIQPHRRKIMTAVVDRAARIFGVRSENIIGASQTAEDVKARYATIYALSKKGFTNPELREFFERDRTTIIYAIASAKERLNLQNHDDRRYAGSVKTVEMQLEKFMGGDFFQEEDEITRAVLAIKSRISSVRQRVQDCLAEMDILDAEMERVQIRHDLLREKKSRAVS